MGFLDNLFRSMRYKPRLPDETGVHAHAVMPSGHYNIMRSDMGYYLVRFSNQDLVFKNKESLIKWIYKKETLETAKTIPNKNQYGC